MSLLSILYTILFISLSTNCLGKVGKIPSYGIGQTVYTITYYIYDTS